jgi:hypothetical protein
MLVSPVFPPKSIISKYQLIVPIKLGLYFLCFECFTGCRFRQPAWNQRFMLRIFGCELLKTRSLWQAFGVRSWVLPRRRVALRSAAINAPALRIVRVMRDSPRAAGPWAPRLPHRGRDAGREAAHGGGVDRPAAGGAAKDLRQQVIPPSFRLAQTISASAAAFRARSSAERLALEFGAHR